MVLILLAQAMRLLSLLSPKAAAGIALRLTRRTRRREPGAVGRPPADRFLVRGGEVVVHRAGRDGGPKALLVHGWNGAASDWRELAEALVTDGFAVTALDLPAHGASRGRISSLPRFVRGVLEADRRHGPFDLWVAHSMGGAAVLAALARGVQARKVVLLGGLVDPAGSLREFARGFGLSAAATRAYLAGIEREEAMALADLDGLHNAHTVHAPVLIVHDRDDRVVPVAQGRALAGALQRGRLLQTSGLGHRRILKDAGIVRSIVEFAQGGARSRTPAHAGEA